MKALHMITFSLVIVGAINWGLMGLMGINLVNMIFGSVAWMEGLIYIAVGVSGVWLAMTHMKDCKMCSTKK